MTWGLLADSISNLILIRVCLDSREDLVLEYIGKSFLCSILFLLEEGAQGRVDYEQEKVAGRAVREKGKKEKEKNEVGQLGQADWFLGNRPTAAFDYKNTFLFYKHFSNCKPI
jgi:hypothetical protein